VLTDTQGQAVSNAINWQDQRALQSFPGDTAATLTRSTGTSRLRIDANWATKPGLACRSVTSSGSHGMAAASSSRVRGCSAQFRRREPLWRASEIGRDQCLRPRRAQCRNPGLAPVGHRQTWACGVHWPEIVPQGTVLGEYRAGSHKLPVFAPVGDYHCSQVGAFLDEGELSVNISTGSAVIQLARGCEFGDFQTRPWFDGRFLKTITHIPGGRALNALVRLLSELAEAQGLRLRDPWDYILAEAAKIASTDLRVDPAFYFSAMGDRGSFANVREDNLTAGHLFHAAFTGWRTTMPNAQLASRQPRTGHDWSSPAAWHSRPRCCAG